MDEKELQEFRKLCAARFAWPIRNERTTNDPGIDWAQWFEAMFGENICDYRARVSKHESHGNDDRRADNRRAV